MQNFKLKNKLFYICIRYQKQFTMQTTSYNLSAVLPVNFWPQLKNHLIDLLLILLLYYVVSTRTISVSLSVDGPQVGWVQDAAQQGVLIEYDAVKEDL